MKTLFEWNGDSHETLMEMLAEFGVAPTKLSLLKYETITPDSYIWIFNADDDRYCLYAEDYVVELDEVTTQIKSHGWTWVPDEQYELIPRSEESLKVDSIKKDDPSRRSEEFTKYAARSGSDYVFLAKAVRTPSADYWT